MHAVILPHLTADAEMTIIRWLCDEGETVGVGDELIEVMAEGTVFKITADKEGILSAIVCRAGDVVTADTKVAELADIEDVETA